MSCWKVRKQTQYIFLGESDGKKIFSFIDNQDFIDKCLHCKRFECQNCLSRGESQNSNLNLYDRFGKEWVLSDICKEIGDKLKSGAQRYRIKTEYNLSEYELRIIIKKYAPEFIVRGRGKYQRQRIKSK